MLCTRRRCTELAIDLIRSRHEARKSAAVDRLTQSRFAALARAAGFWWERQLPSARIVKHFRQVIARGQKSQPSLKHFEKQVSRHAPGSHLSRHHVHIFSRKGCLIVNLGTAPESSGVEFGHAALLVQNSNKRVGFA